MKPKDYTIERTDKPALLFRGYQLAKVASSSNAESPYYSGAAGRWQTLALYKTSLTDMYVCERINHTNWQGELELHGGISTDKLKEVIEFFGHGRLAKQLYELTGIEDVEVVT